MAIVILGKSRCPICGQILQVGDDIIGTTHFLTSGPLSRYSDAGMHRQCFIAWPQAAEFRTAFNQVGGPRQMLSDGSIVEVEWAPDQSRAQEGEKSRLTIAVLGESEERDQLLAALQSTEKCKRR